MAESNKQDVCQKAERCESCSTGFACMTLGSALAIMAHQMHKWPREMRQDAESLLAHLRENGWKTGAHCRFIGRADVVSYLTEQAGQIIEAVRAQRRQRRAS